MLLTGIKTLPQVCVPQEHAALFGNFLESCRLLFTGGKPIQEEEKKGRIVPVAEGSCVELGKNHVARVFAMDHCVPRVGYGIAERRRKLAAGLSHLEPKQLKALPKEQREVLVEIPKLAFLCDTTPSIFARYPELFDYPNILIECTFYDDETLKLAPDAHSHWSDLEPIVRGHPSNLFILIHFSIRYASIEIPDLPANAMIWEN